MGKPVVAVGLLGLTGGWGLRINSYEVTLQLLICRI